MTNQNDTTIHPFHNKYYSLISNSFYVIMNAFRHKLTREGEREEGRDRERQREKETERDRQRERETEREYNDLFSDNFPTSISG